MDSALPLAERTYDQDVGAFVPLTGEPLALDLVNTHIPLRGVGWVDALDSLAGLRAWIELQPELRPVVEGTLTASDLTAVHTLRAHVTSAMQKVRHGLQPSVTSLRGINRALAASPVRAHLTWNGESLVQEAIYSRVDGRALVAQLAWAAANLLSDPRVTSIRDCEMSDCLVLFYPANSRRKWCIDAICGNRARVARHYRKHRSTADHQA